MGNSLRSVQAALQPLAIDEQRVFYQSGPTFLQSALTANSAPVNTSTVLVDSGLAVEVSSGAPLDPLQLWNIAGTLYVTTTGAAGVQVQITNGGGLNIVQSNISYALQPAAGGGPAPVAAVGSPATSGAVNVAAVSFFGTIQLQGYGTLKLQFAQAVSTATNTTINALSYLEAYTIV